MATSSSGRDKLGSLTKTTIKRSFDYKMCKKVAELTQVVHMLFTKSHEKDLELDLTRKAYEEEITNVVKDGESRIKKMELSLAEQNRRNDIKCSQITLQHEKKLESCMKEYTSKISDLDKEISSLTKQIVSLREELKTYNLPNVKPKSDDHNTSCNVRRASVKLSPVDNVESNANVNGNTYNNSNTKQVVEEKHGANSKSSEGYLKQISELEDITRGKDLKIQNLQQLQSRAEEETLKMRDRLSEVELKKEDILKKFMESEKFRTNQQERIKVLEKELKGQQKEIQKLQARPRTRSRQSSSPVLLSASTENIPKSNVETSYEMDRLKKEVERYRLELSNREGNFNRMFTSTNPVRVDTSLRGLSLGMTRQKPDVSAPNFNPLQSHIAGAGRSELRKPRLIDKRLPLLSMEGRSKTSTNLTQHGAAAGNKNFSRKTDMFQQAF